MYPRNAASPPRITVGAVVQISNGAVQSAGVSIVVCPEGGAEAAGGGTIEYSAASNVVYYTPTQAETNYTAFCVIAYKTGCLPADKTVVTTTTSVSGTVDVGAISAAIANKIADHIKRRTQANTEVSSDGDALDAGSIYGLIQQAQESNAVTNPGQLTIYRTDGTTELVQKALTTDAGATPITGIS